MEKVRYYLRRNSRLLQHLQKKSIWKGALRVTLHRGLQGIISSGGYVISQARGTVLVSCWLHITATARTSAWSLPAQSCSYLSHGRSGSRTADRAGHTAQSLRPGLARERAEHTWHTVLWSCPSQSGTSKSLHLWRPASVVVLTQENHKRCPMPGEDCEAAIHT